MTYCKSFHVLTFESKACSLCAIFHCRFPGTDGNINSPVKKILAAAGTRTVTSTACISDFSSEAHQSHISRFSGCWMMRAAGETPEHTSGLLRRQQHENTMTVVPLYICCVGNDTYRAPEGFFGHIPSHSFLLLIVYLYFFTWR